VITSSAWQQLIVWVLTYAAHSTVLLVLAWCVTRRLSRERLRWHERIWKAAILGGLLSASLQVGFDVSPAAGRLEWDASAAPLASALPDAAPIEVLESGASLSDALGGLSWEGFLVGLWMLGGLVGLALFLFAWRRIADRLAGRAPVRSGPAYEALARLASRAGLRKAPRLVESSSLKSPATIGVFLPQICVPRRARVELPPEQQEALVAHELAHILRADPLWFFVIGLIERVFFFQPLHRVARRELEELAEFLSDDWAAQNTGDEVGLARCLTEVATWVLELRPVVAVVPMAASNSRLAARIGRLLDEDRRPQDHGASRAHGLLCVAGLAAAVLALPGAGAVAASEPLETRPIPKAAPLGSATESTSEATSAEPAAPALDELLGVLDEEVDHLVREVGALGEEIVTEAAPSPERLQAVRELGRRMNQLRERQERLRELLPDLVVPLGPASDSTPEPLLETAR